MSSISHYSHSTTKTQLWRHTSTTCGIQKRCTSLLCLLAYFNLFVFPFSFFFFLFVSLSFFFLLSFSLSLHVCGFGSVRLCAFIFKLESYLYQAFRRRLFVTVYNLFSMESSITLNNVFIYKIFDGPFILKPMYTYVQ